MNGELYGEAIEDLAECADYKGLLESPDYSVRLDNPLCGDEIVLELEVDPETGVIRKVRFDCDGCVMSQAGSTRVAQLVEGLTLQQARGLSDQVMMKELPIQISPTRIKCWLLGWRAVQHALPESVVANPGQGKA